MTDREQQGFHPPLPYSIVLSQRLSSSTSEGERREIIKISRYLVVSYA